MDLKKILNQRESSSLAFAKANIPLPGAVFFDELKLRLEGDLAFLRQQKTMPQNAIFERTAILSGHIEGSDKLKKQSLKTYVFLQLPYVPGFLIEYHDNPERYIMMRATKVNPVHNTQTGEIVRPEFFVLKSPILEEFIVLEKAFVRTKYSDRTLSVEQMSEMLWLLTSEDWPS